LHSALLVAGEFRATSHGIALHAARTRSHRLITRVGRAALAERTSRKPPRKPEEVRARVGASGRSIDRERTTQTHTHTRVTCRHGALS